MTDDLVPKILAVVWFLSLIGVIVFGAFEMITPGIACAVVFCLLGLAGALSG